MQPTILGRDVAERQTRASGSMASALDFSTHAARPKAGEVQLWADFTCLKARGQVPKHSILWLIDVDAPAFQEAWRQVQQERPEAVS